MKITGGSKTAIALLDKLQQQGDLVDVYSKSFFDRQPSIKDDPNAEYNQGDFEYLLEQFENNEDDDLKPIGHLFLIHVDDYKKEIRKELVDLFKPLGTLIDVGKHNPDFLILNLFTKQVLCVGLGRKNRLFVIDAATEETVNVFGLLGPHHHGGLTNGKDADYMERFTQHDVFECVSDLIHAVHKLGVAMFGYDSIQANEEYIEHTLHLGPNENGVYQLKNWEDEILDEEEFSKEQIVEMLKDSKGYQAEIDDALRVINIFFPQCERGELNTGDY